MGTSPAVPGPPAESRRRRTLPAGLHEIELVFFAIRLFFAEGGLPFFSDLCQLRLKLFQL